ncbi:retrovirus-related Pol polyprotein from transposon TNT 1-94 [Trichonephila clavipes]|uniref:Retrovirus-related Pol polyprotein from transposon TNT 1-94 n=1 Tax=Trichonephila clavipes TaxID=2585209 RepID=A0A8X6VNN1_TRICX|nr:retrovirus-related Pol polyprotein from transposon TNT 1-94 [Trichonephila clavipes]
MRAKMGFMMGYAQRTKGYRIWLIDENKLVETINGFSDLSEQQEALMVEVTIPNCYKQAIRSRDASKWHDAMDKEINVMMERKVWDLVDHPDNIKILENRWVYTIKYDENNKIVRYKGPAYSCASAQAILGIRQDGTLRLSELISGKAGKGLKTFSDESSERLKRIFCAINAYGPDGRVIAYGASTPHAETGQSRTQPFVPIAIGR